MTPRLIVGDVSAEVRFVTKVFGATELPSPGPAVLQIGDSRLMVSAVDPRPATESLLYVYVDDVDAVCRRAVKAGARLLEAPAQMPYGDRRAMVEDPSGTVWQIASAGSARPARRPSRQSRRPLAGSKSVAVSKPGGRTRGQRS